MTKFRPVKNRSKNPAAPQMVRCLEEDCGEIIKKSDAPAHVFAKHMTAEAIDLLKADPKVLAQMNLLQPKKE